MLFSRLSVCLLLVASGAFAQVVSIENSDPTTGTSNAFPFNRPNGFTTLHVYLASQLTAAGIPAGATLLQAEVAPSTAGTGTYNAPMARMSIGHLLNSPPIAGAWESNLLAPTTVHSLASGPYTFNYTLDTWSPLPGFDTAGFVWDGTTDIAIFYTSSPGTTGGFNVHRTATNLRHAVTVFGATTETPTSNGNFAMKVRLTFCSANGVFQVNQPQSEMNVNGMVATPCFGAVANISVNMSAVIGFNSTTPGMGYDIAVDAPGALVPLGGGAAPLAGSGQILNLDITSPGFVLINSLSFPPFPGNFALTFSSPTPVSFAGQLAVLTPANPDGLSLSGGVQVNIQ